MLSPLQINFVLGSLVIIEHVSFNANAKHAHFSFSSSSFTRVRVLNMWQNWFPRRVMNAWHIAGIVHALEGWNEHECGNTMSNIEKVWQASLQHGFQPLLIPTESKC